MAKTIRRFKQAILKRFREEPVFSFGVLLLIALTVFFRFYNWVDRIYIHADNSLFTQAAKYGADHLLIPQIGPFSQSTFFTGPWWLWILEVVYFLPFGILSPWLFMSLLSLLFVYLIFLIGKEIGGRWIGLVAALLAAVSTAQIDNSFTVWNASIDPLISLLAIFFLIRVYKYKKALDLLLLTFTVTLGTTIHFQNSMLAPIILVSLFVSKPNLTKISNILLGFLIPLLPFIYFDIRFHWFWLTSVIVYLAVDQYRFAVANRWLTYAGIYWPETWSSIVGGQKIVGYLIIGVLSTLTLLRLKLIKKYTFFYLIAIPFVLEVILFRYFKGQKFYYFSNFTHPSVIILTAWVIGEVYKLRAIIGIILGFLIFALTLNFSLKNLTDREITLKEINFLKEEIYRENPKDFYKIYGCSHTGALISHPLALMIYSDKKEQAGGEKIGVCFQEDKSFSWVVLAPSDLEGKGSPWLNHSTGEIYRSMTEWWKEKPPQPGGNLWEFLKENVGKN